MVFAVCMLIHLVACSDQKIVSAMTKSRTASLERNSCIAVVKLSRCNLIPAFIILCYCEANNIDIDFNLRKGKKDIHTGAMEEITSAECSDFVLIIYEDTDSAGHDFGFSFNNPVYKEGFLTEDAYGYEVIKAIEARETYETEDWLIIVTSDHGGIRTGHGGPSIQERMNFVVMNKEW